MEGLIETYYVPAIMLVSSSVCSTLNILAKPKSEIFGFISASSNIFAALRSR